MGTQDGIAALTFDPEQIRCVSALLRHGVELMVTGGYAVRFHGHMRFAKDLDVLVGNDRQNAERLCFALTDILRVAHPSITPEAFEGQSRQVNFESWGLKFEVLTGAAGVDFQRTYGRRFMVPLGIAEVPVIPKDALIAMKRIAGRSVDLSDIAALEATTT